MILGPMSSVTTATTVPFDISRHLPFPVATYIMENGLTLEEFHVELQAAIDDFTANGGPAFLVEGFIQVSAEDKYD